MKIEKLNNFYQSTVKNPHKQIKYTGYAAMTTCALCFVKPKPRKLHKKFGILTGIFTLAHWGLIEYYKSRKAHGKN